MCSGAVVKKLPADAEDAETRKSGLHGRGVGERLIALESW